MRVVLVRKGLQEVSLQKALKHLNINKVKRQYLFTLAPRTKKIKYIPFSVEQLWPYTISYVKSEVFNLQAPLILDKQKRIIWTVQNDLIQVSTRLGLHIITFLT